MKKNNKLIGLIIISSVIVGGCIISHEVFKKRKREHKTQNVIKDLNKDKDTKVEKAFADKKEACAAEERYKKEMGLLYNNMGYAIFTFLFLNVIFKRTFLVCGSFSNFESPFMKSKYKAVYKNSKPLWKELILLPYRPVLCKVMEEVGMSKGSWATQPKGIIYIQVLLLLFIKIKEICKKRIFR